KPSWAAETGPAPESDQLAERAAHERGIRLGAELADVGPEGLRDRNQELAVRHGREHGVAFAAPRAIDRAIGLELQPAAHSELAVRAASQHGRHVARAVERRIAHVAGDVDQRAVERAVFVEL